MPAFLRVAHTVDAAMVMPSRASSPWRRRYPQVGFLASEADDRVSGLNRGGWPAGPMRVAPVVRDQASMPSQDRAGLHEEDRPSVTVEHTRQRREDRTLGGVRSTVAGPEVAGQ